MLISRGVRDDSLNHHYVSIGTYGFEIYPVADSKVERIEFNMLRGINGTTSEPRGGRTVDRRLQFGGKMNYRFHRT